MITARTLTVTGALALACCTTATDMHVRSETHSTARIAYPPAQRTAVVDDYGGTKVADPYRWLEDPDAPATRAWIEGENRLTREYIDRVPERREIEERIASLWNYERFGVPVKRGGQYFFTRNDGLQNQAVLCTTAKLDATPRVLLDPNTLRADGTVAVTEWRPSGDGKLLAYQLSEGGSDWTTIRVRNVATGADLDDKVEWVKFSSVAWAHDAHGFYYSTYPEHDTTGTLALKNHRLLFHALGTPQSKDVVVFERPDQPDWGFGGSVSDDGRYLIVAQTEGTEEKNRLYVADLALPKLEWRALFDRFDAAYEVLGNAGTRFIVRTDAGAPQGRIVAVDLEHTQKNEFEVVVPEADEALDAALLSGGKIVVKYMKDATNEVRVFERDGRLRAKVALPGLGTVTEFQGEFDESEAFFSFTSFNTPTQVWRYDIESRTPTLWRAPKVLFAPGDYTTEQVFFASRDGTRVPMFVTHRRDVVLSPNTPTFMYGYGGFNIPILPAFSPALLVWMERGGSYVSVNLRGGSEYGREWHEAGTKARKQNVFDDFIGAAEFLIAKGWTSSKKLAIHGRSNGGLLVGACMTQRPDLFGAALPGVGVLDMLRYHRFTIGWAWASDYGRSDEASDFPYLIKYSPLHNVKAGVRYPATLITTGDHDDRVVPAHSFKFAAELQHAQAANEGAPPILIRVETRGGHGAGKPTSMQIEELADEFAFLSRALDIHQAAPRN